jgi:hypothetical protein
MASQFKFMLLSSVPSQRFYRWSPLLFVVEYFLWLAEKVYLGKVRDSIFNICSTVVYGVWSRISGCLLSSPSIPSAISTDYRLSRLL